MEWTAAGMVNPTCAAGALQSGFQLGAIPSVAVGFAVPSAIPAVAAGSSSAVTSRVAGGCEMLLRMARPSLRERQRATKKRT